MRAHCLQSPTINIECPQKIYSVIRKATAKPDIRLHHLTEEELLYHATPGGGHWVSPSVLLLQ